MFSGVLMDKNLLKILKNLIRIGEISAIHDADGTVEVVFEDKNDIVSDPLPYLAFEYNMPQVKDRVLCVFLGNGITSGFCLGKFFSAKSPPPVQNKDIYYKDFFGEAFLKYEKSTKTLTLNAENIVFDGDLLINGNVIVNGNFENTGVLIAGNGATGVFDITQATSGIVTGGS